MTNSPVKVGMVGAGFILRPHAIAVSSIDGATLHAVADTSASRAAEAARQFGFAHAFSSVEELADSDCEVVHVLVPPFLHLQVAEMLLNAGKSVFLEKPMGLSSADCLRLGALAEDKGLRLGVNHNFLFLPGYERLRTAVAEGSLGRLDQISCAWNYELPQLKGGPFDAWMLSAPANLFFELGPHLAAFLLDLLGEAAVRAAVASSPVELPTKQQAYRSWAAIGGGVEGSFLLSISANPGQADRLLRVRASGGSAQLDFGRDIYWEERAGPANPIFDAHAVAVNASRQLRAAAARDRRRRVLAALGKSLESEPFTESMARSIARFYADPEGPLDERHHWRFGAKTIGFCEEVCKLAGVGQPSAGPVSMPVPDLGSAPQPKVLVVGAAGFIGRALVARLVAKGLGVRVMSRSRNAAAIAFSGLPVDICEGSHGNRDAVRTALSGIAIVYHLAKCEGKRWEEYVRGDIEPTRVLAEEAIGAGVKRFIYTGTIDSYDSASPRKRITGDTPLDPAIGSRNLYARSKAACENLLRELSRDKGLPLVVVRPAIVIGAGAPAAHIGVAQFSSETDVTYWGRGDNKLPLVLVEDVAEALAAAADASDIVGRSFVLTSEPLLSARDYVAELCARARIKIRASERPPWRYWAADMVKEVAKNLVRHPNRRWPSLHDWRCRAHRSTYDSSAAREALGWEPASNRQTLVERGIHAAVDSSAR
jgi:predicted dehydrogenase/nucleoside-diphosphate-sugar epimerase